MPARRLLRTALVLLPALLAVVGLTVLARRRTRPPADQYWDVPSFHLIDQNGHTVTRDDLEGVPWIAGFIFTRCSGICPAMTARMARLQSQLPASYRLLSITVDPEYDTEVVLKRYAKQTGAGPRWIFLTGPREDLYRLAVEGFKLEALELPPGQADPFEGPFLHSGKLALVDQRAHIRGYYDSSDDSAMDRLLSDALHLARSSS